MMPWDRYCNICCRKRHSGDVEGKELEEGTVDTTTSTEQRMTVVGVGLYLYGCGVTGSSAERLAQDQGGTPGRRSESLQSQILHWYMVREETGEGG